MTSAQTDSANALIAQLNNVYHISARNPGGANNIYTHAQFDPTRHSELAGAAAQVQALQRKHIREPVSAMACNLILMQPEERVFSTMAQQFNQAPVSMRACLEGRASLFQHEHPAEYELARGAMRKVAQLAVYADAVKPAQ